ncbi:tRNA (Guanine37-N1)-methyltransferase [hydrothermal vent metagenome]|uniref:tRNA (guanine-N(1)-)-methyltransferase n=1 Tax=hydrothermal vent metagenome TaxID=652676 RepID=A0A1W1BIX2_9ZZZZ
MQFNVITIFPEMFDAIKKEGVIARALKKKLISLNLHQLRDYSNNKYRNIDDKPYGGGGGMVMQVKPIRDCLKQIKKNNPNTKVIYLSPQGKKLTHNLTVELSQERSLTLLCGRYEGVDERIIQHDIDMEISIGDYVLSGGEIPAMVLIDSIGRQINDVLGNQNSLNDSFQNNLLDYPHYTRPSEIDNQKVPEILLNGNQAEINKWRQQQSIKNTQNKRPDLL